MTTTVARGQVVAAGTPVANTTVTTLVEPSADALAANPDGLSPIPLEQTTTDVNGSFLLTSTAFAQVPANYRADDGGISVALTVADATRSIEWHYTLYPADSNTQTGYRIGSFAPELKFDFVGATVIDVNNPPSDWVNSESDIIGYDEDGDPIGDDSLDVAEQTSAASVAVEAPNEGKIAYADAYFSAPAASQQQVLAGTKDPGVLVAERQTPTQKSAIDRAQAASSAHTITGTGRCRWMMTQDYTYRTAYVNKIYSANNISFSIVAGTEGNSEFTFGIAREGKDGLWKSDGSVHFTAKHTNEAHFDSTATGKDKLDKNGNVIEYGGRNYAPSHEVLFRKIEDGCGQTMWKAQGIASLFTAFPVRIPHVKYNTYCATRAPGNLIMSGETSETTAGALTIVGISVSGQSGWKKSQQVTFDYPNDNGYICGNKRTIPKSSAFDARWRP